MEDWRRKNEEISERVLEVIEPLGKELAEEFEMHENTIYDSIASNAHRLHYSRQEPPIVNQSIETLRRKLTELDGIKSLVWNEKSEVEKQIGHLKTELLKSTKLLSSFTWEIGLSRRNNNKLFLTADRDSVDEQDSNLTYIFSDFGISSRAKLYVFSDGRVIDHYFNRDDSYFKIIMDLEEVTPQEYRRAFEELGIVISFDEIERSIAEKRDALQRQEDLIQVFR